MSMVELNITHVELNIPHFAYKFGMITYIVGFSDQ